MDGEYRVEFENPDGLLLDGGTMVFVAGHFEGGMGGYHYAGKFETRRHNRFRAEGKVSRPRVSSQKAFGVFGDEHADFEMIMVGHFDGGEIRGLLVRTERPYITMRFHLTPKMEAIEDAS